MSSVPKGWRKIEKIRESGKTKGKKDVYLFSPEGTKIRSNVELQTYLKDRKSKLTLDFQSLSTKIKLSSAVKKTKDTVKPARNLPKKSVKRNSLKLKVSAKDKKSPKSLQKTSTSNKNKSVVKSTLKRKTIRSEKENTKKSNDSDEESLIDVENVQEENLVKEDIKSGMLDKKPRKVTTTKKKNNEKNPATDYPKVAKKFPSQVVKKCVITRKPSGKDSKGMPDMPKSSKDINNTIAAERSRKSTRRQEAKSGVKVEPQRQKKNLNVRKRPITKNPDGMKIRSNVELQTYLKVRKSKLTLDFQTLSSKIKLSSAVKKTKDAVKPARNMPPTKLKLLKLKVLAKDKKSPKSLQKTSTSDQNKSVKSAPKKKTISIVKEKKITKKSNDSDEESLIDIENLREENLVKEYIKSGALIATKNDNNEINPVTYYYPRPARKFPSQVVKKCVITRKPSGKDSKGMPDMPKSSIDINNTIAAERSRKSTRCQEAKSMEDKNKISAPSTSSYQELIEHHGEPQRQEEILNASKASNEEDSEEDPNSSKDINCAMEDENKTMPISTSHPHNLYEGDSQRQEQILNASNASNEEDSKEDPNSSKDINFAMEDEDKTMPISTSHPQNLYEGDSQRQEQILNEEVQPQNIFSRILTLFKDAKCMMQDVFSAKK